MYKMLIFKVKAHTQKKGPFYCCVQTQRCLMTPKVGSFLVIVTDLVIEKIFLKTSISPFPPFLPPKSPLPNSPTAEHANLKNPIPPKTQIT